MTITTVLLDMDGVVRHFRPHHAADVEAAHGLATGTLTGAAFDHAMLHDLVTGRRSRAEWVQAIAEAVGNQAAVHEWLSDRGTIDESMLAEVDRLRAGGVPVAILTNGTDETRTEVVEMGLVDRFDAIFSTADIGHAKPDPRAFTYVANELGVDPTEVFFTDDTESKLAGAVDVGMTARHYTDLESFRRHLDEVGLLTG